MNGLNLYFFNLFRSNKYKNGKTILSFPTPVTYFMRLIEK